MADDQNAPSNGADETLLPDEIEKVEAPDSFRSSFEKAFDDVIEGPSEKTVQPRDEKGKFAPKSEAVEKVEAAPEAPAPKVEKVEPAQLDQPAVQEVPPPSRFTAQAKEAWNSAPPALRQEVARMEAELTKGIETYKAAYEPLKPFDDMARQHGKELPAVIKDFVETEDFLRAKPVEGIAYLCQRMGVDPAAIGQALIGLQGQGGAQPEVAALHNKIAQLEQQLSGFTQTLEQREAQKEIDAFASANPRFEELRPRMGQLLQAGVAGTLQEAYEMADRLSPAPTPAFAAQQPAPVPQTPKARLSITGSSTGSNPPRAQTGSFADTFKSRLEEVGL